MVLVFNVEETGYVLVSQQDPNWRSQSIKWCTGVNKRMVSLKRQESQLK